MEGFCILRASKLVIGSAISCCANRPQQTKCEQCIRFPLYLFRISWILLWMEMKLSQLQMISGQRGGLKVNYIDQPELPSIPFYSDCHLYLWHGIWQRKIFCLVSHLIQDQMPICRQNPFWFRVLLQYWLWARLGSKTIKACGWNERKWPEENWESQASNAPRCPPRPLNLTTTSPIIVLQNDEPQNCLIESMLLEKFQIFKQYLGWF